GELKTIAPATVEVRMCAAFVNTSDPVIVAVDDDPSDRVIGVVLTPASVTVLPAVSSNAGVVEPETVSVTPADEDSVAPTLLMKRSRPMVCWTTPVTTGDTVELPSNTRMSLEAGVVRVGVQFVAVVQLPLDEFQTYVVWANATGDSKATSANEAPSAIAVRAG